MINPTRKCSGRCARILPLDTLHFYRDARACQGFFSRCKDCHKEQTKAWAKANPEKRRASGRKSKARQYARMVADPERLATRREYERNYSREWWRRKHGVKNERGEHRKPVENRGSSWDAIDAGPFRDWLLSIRSEFEHTRAMATSIGVNDSTLSKVMAGTKTTVAFSTVDRALCGYGRPDLLEHLYPGGPC